MWFIVVMSSFRQMPTWSSDSAPLNSVGQVGHESKKALPYIQSWGGNASPQPVYILGALISLPFLTFPI